MSKQKKTTLIIVAVAIVLVIALLVVWATFRPGALEGVKEITVNVTHTDESTYTNTFETTAKYLAEALEPYDLLDGDETEYGLFVKTVDGEYANDAEGAYWMYDANGTMAEYGVDTQPIEDGDVYDFYIMTY
ncbi:MAG: DUF4430 domain-containing protein [Oscillospiraceae bacterium]